MHPLEGITVVSLEHAIAAPFASRQLADLGARVIKVERPGDGDFARAYDERVNGLSSHFVWTNRSKESVSLDLKSDHGKEALHLLISRADVLIQNLAPGALSRMGFDVDAIQKDNPELIICEISGYGQDGPHRDRKAYDLLIQAESGFLSITGTPDHVAKSGCSIADISAGMYAYSSILAALYERHQTGKGKRIDISMLESMAEWMGFPLYYAFDGAHPPQRSGAMHATIYPYGPFSTMDGEVLLAIQNDREWTSFCKLVLDQPELAQDKRFATSTTRSENRDILKVILDEALSLITASQLIEVLDRAKIANAKINDMEGLWSHEQLKMRNRWTEVDSPAGSLPALIPPGMEDAMMKPIPEPGEHTEKILQEIGMIAGERGRA